MFLRLNTLAEQAYSPAEHVVRCATRLEDDTICEAWVPLRLHEKTRCAECGATHPAYSHYSKSRTRFKAVTDAG